jgi:isoleucyl-tRNA synthetase
LLILSQINIVEEGDIKDPFISTEFAGLTIGVTKARGKKCDRCWVYSEAVGANREHPDICDRCLSNL